MQSIYLEGLEPSNVIPNYATVDEFALYTIASVEESYRDMIEDIGVYELSLVMNEADGDADKKKKLDVKKVFEKVKDFIVGIFKKIGELIGTIARKIELFIREKFKGLIKKDKLKETLALMPEEAFTKPDKNKKETEEFTFDEKSAGEVITAIINGQTDIKKIADKLATDKDALKDVNYKQKSAEIFKNNLSFLNLADDADAAAIKQAIQNYCSTTTVYTKKYIEDNLDKMYKDLVDGRKAFMTEMKKPYTEAKKTLDTMIDDAKKSDESKSMLEISKLASSYAKYVSSYINAIGTLATKQLVINARILAKISMYHAKKSDDKTTVTAKNESATFQSELASLFNF